MKTLDLVLKHKWYDMIESGEKPEEYREVTHHWMSRLFLPGDYLYLYKPLRKYAVDKFMIQRIKRDLYEDFTVRWNSFTHVRFHRGYTSTTMTFEIKDISIGKGKSEWGAPDYETFIIKLGSRSD